MYISFHSFIFFNFMIIIPDISLFLIHDTFLIKDKTLLILDKTINAAVLGR